MMSIIYDLCDALEMEQDSKGRESHLDAHYKGVLFVKQQSFWRELAIPLKAVFLYVGRCSRGRSEGPIDDAQFYPQPGALRNPERIAKAVSGGQPFSLLQYTYCTVLYRTTTTLLS